MKLKLKVLLFEVYFYVRHYVKLQRSFIGKLGPSPSSSPPPLFTHHHIPQHALDDGNVMNKRGSLRNDDPVVWDCLVVYCLLGMTPPQWPLQCLSLSISLCLSSLSDTQRLKELYYWMEFPTTLFLPLTHFPRLLLWSWVNLFMLSSRTDCSSAVIITRAHHNHTQVLAHQNIVRI